MTTKGAAKQHKENFSEFIDLYKVIFQEVQMVGKGGRRPPPVVAVDVKRPILKAVIKQGANLLPFVYQNAYVKPLRKNLRLVVAQNPPSDSAVLENIIGAVYDHADQSGVQPEVRQLLAVISNLYRTFLRAPNIKDLERQPQYVIPPLATFQYEMTEDDLTPSTLPVDEVNLLFGGSVGIVIMPDLYRAHPILWSALVHEVGGHDLLRADREMLPELELGVLEWFDSKSKVHGDREFLGKLWRYWIGEAAADVCGILNMGPSYALAAAVSAAALNKDLMAVIMRKYRRQDKAAFAALQKADRQMADRPVLLTSPPPKPELDDLDTHPSDVLRLYTMIGAIERLSDYKDISKGYDYVGRIKEVVRIGTTQADGAARPGSNEVRIRGFIQTGPDTWEERDEKIDLEIMKQSAIEIGRYVVEQEFNFLRTKGGDKQEIQKLVTWTIEQERIAQTIAGKLLLKPEKPPSISSSGDDSQLLAGAMLALLEKPTREFYRLVSKRLAEALQTSFDRDEVWGYSYLSRVWSPSPSPTALGSSSRGVMR